MAVYSTLAAVDLGSNSFHLQVARVVGDQIYPLDSLREPIRLGAGLNREKRLDEESQQRALECLKRFGERLRGFDPQVCGRSAPIRCASRRTPRHSLKAPKRRLAFRSKSWRAVRRRGSFIVGVAHSLPLSKDKRLVVDIGGGSTEFIIGASFKPLRLESLYMGCVSYSLKYFPDGKDFQERDEAGRTCGAQ